MQTQLFTPILFVLLQSHRIKNLFLHDFALGARCTQSIVHHPDVQIDHGVVVKEIIFQDQMLQNLFLGTDLVAGIEQTVGMANGGAFVAVKTSKTPQPIP